jgi:dipeptidase E
MVTNRDLQLECSSIWGEEDWQEKKPIPGLHLVDFYVLPHLDFEYFKNLKEEIIRQTFQGMTETLYVLDDQSALKVVDSQVEVISEGRWFVMNKK